MNYRILGRTALSVSEVALGCEHLQGMDYKSVQAVIHRAAERGINYLDIFMSEPEVRTNIGKAIAGRRDQFILQGHIGAAWIDGQYCRSRDLETNKFFFDDFCIRLQTDYADIGMIHFVDTEDDFTAVFESEIIEYAKELKASGRIKALGMSSHNPLVALKAVQTGLLDVLMFSVNPAYDILPADIDIDALFKAESYTGAGLTGSNPERLALYDACVAAGTALTVMKGFGAGALLKAETSPFSIALTPAQCIHYALSRPGAAAILVGCRTPQEVDAAANYETAPDSERDYSELLSATPKYSLRGKCMYCNHCLPCPSRIDIAAVNKYLDLCLVQGNVPPTVKAHYEALSSHAADCIGCGLCETRCPFGVQVIARMEQAASLFGK